MANKADNLFQLDTQIIDSQTSRVLYIKRERNYLVVELKIAHIMVSSIGTWCGIIESNA